ncbi:CDP-2,3-bis-(O-geranylgeranyl)-sn-glycerol synthase [Candidatus Micrarchaeota archaeon]|nr:CDP-2,3-bis-(O-geranylgeranyl)-sn-glycerol synthase [Candidatus Micrarchaeota archaeon]
MDRIANIALDLIIFLIPIYVANSTPVILGGGTPLDLGTKLWDGKPLFGESKTIRGFISGVLGGTVMGGIIASFYLLPFFSTAQDQFIAAIMMSFGTMSGDAIGSFIKRRFSMEPGKPFILDTILFVIVALVLVYPFAKPELYGIYNIAFFLGLSLILHPLTNFIANRLGLKKVPW